MGSAERLNIIKSNKIKNLEEIIFKQYLNMKV
jgi:hypothetical protein